MGDVATDVIYYPPTYIPVTNCDKVYFDLYNANFKGTAVWVHMKPGAPVQWIDYTWRYYYRPNVVRDYVLYDINENHPKGVTLNDVLDVHIKYFSQGSGAYKMIHRGTQKEVSLMIGGTTKKIELWSEITWDYLNNRWVHEYGYPWANYGGATLIDSRNYVYTSTGNACYATYYPTLSYRSFGGGSETGIILTLWSHPLHQQAIEAITK